MIDKCLRQLGEETGESRNHVASDKVVHALNAIEIAHDPCGKIAEVDRERNIWIKLQLSLEVRRYHYTVILEAHRRLHGSGSVREGEPGFVSVNRDSTVLIDVTHHVELPKQMGSGIGCLIRLQ